MNVQPIKDYLNKWRHKIATDMRFASWFFFALALLAHILFPTFLGSVALVIWWSGNLLVFPFKLVFLDKMREMYLEQQEQNKDEK